MQENSWRTPFGLAVLIGGAVSIVIGFAHGTNLKSGLNSDGADVVNNLNSAEAAYPNEAELVDSFAEPAPPSVQPEPQPYIAPREEPPVVITPPELPTDTENEANQFEEDPGED